MKNGYTQFFAALLACFITSNICLGLTVELSQLDESKEARREKAFQPWIPIAEMNVQFATLTAEKKFPILSERDGAGKVREIFIDQPEGLMFWAWTSMDEAELQAKHKKYTEEGFVILTLGLVPDDDHTPSYWGIWVNKSLERKIVSELKRFGITQAAIQLD